MTEHLGRDRKGVTHKHKHHLTETQDCRRRAEGDGTGEGREVLFRYPPQRALGHCLVPSARIPAAPRTPQPARRTLISDRFYQCSSPSGSEDCCVPRVVTQRVPVPRSPVTAAAPHTHTQQAPGVRTPTPASSPGQGMFIRLSFTAYCFLKTSPTSVTRKITPTSRKEAELEIIFQIVYSNVFGRHCPRVDGVCLPGSPVTGPGREPSAPLTLVLV